MTAPHWRPGIFQPYAHSVDPNARTVPLPGGGTGYLADCGAITHIPAPGTGTGALTACRYCTTGTRQPHPYRSEPL